MHLTVVYLSQSFPVLHILQVLQDDYRLDSKDFRAFRVALVRCLTSAEFVFMFMLSTSYVCSIDSYSDNFES